MFIGKRNDKDIRNLYGTSLLFFVPSVSLCIAFGPICFPYILLCNGLFYYCIFRKTRNNDLFLFSIDVLLRLDYLAICC